MAAGMAAGALSLLAALITRASMSTRVRARAWAPFFFFSCCMSSCFLRSCAAAAATSQTPSLLPSLCQIYRFFPTILLSDSQHTTSHEARRPIFGRSVLRQYSFLVSSVSPAFLASRAPPSPDTPTQLCNLCETLLLCDGLECDIFAC